MVQGLAPVRVGEGLLGLQAQAVARHHPADALHDAGPNEMRASDDRQERLASARRHGREHVGDARRLSGCDGGHEAEHLTLMRAQRASRKGLMQSAYPDRAYRINSAATPTVPATSACRGSVVSAVVRLCWAKARQAQSPSERRTLRGAERSSPAASAWARSSATTSRSSSRKSASASFPSSPRSTSLAITSARFAALIDASGRTRSTRSAPGSSNKRQSKAEASRTCPTLLTIRLRPTLRHQLIRHVALAGCEGAELGLNAAQGGAGWADPQLIAVQLHEHGIAFR